MNRGYVPKDLLYTTAAPNHPWPPLSPYEEFTTTEACVHPSINADAIKIDSQFAITTLDEPSKSQLQTPDRRWMVCVGLPALLDGARGALERKGPALHMAIVILTIPFMGDPAAILADAATQKNKINSHASPPFHNVHNNALPISTPERAGAPNFR